ncbi:Aste57867_8352 [Aphanomyces stellatus]|uniref:Aste57867_8352 protein n=1 Tax=Aphanomyces stellatus TaxID=120398 RepID=A0A485KK07_9STRA|nr:hypothetical protein As57867_008320 [Aphanomyces stellatus]VFT85238.1 Aste57867_8352 [Aphanomyces stellatus]
MNPSKEGKKKAMDPSRLNRYVDCPSTRNTDGKCRPSTHLGTIRRSWNGENCDITPFSRLEARGNVVLLENDNIHNTVLGTKPEFNPNVRIRCLETNIMEQAGPAQEGKHMMLTSPESVKNNTIISTAEVGYVRVASAGLQEGIMTPAQRRERLIFETTSERAHALMKRAEMKERRLTQLMQYQYPCGVLGLDGPNNPESQVFAASANRIQKQCEHELRQHRSREENLLRHTSIIPAIGYSYLEHEMAVKPPKVTKVCQEKTKIPGTYQDTHHRIFNETPPIWFPERAQHLRDEGHAGRPYDIVNNGRVEYFPPSIPEKQHPRQGHPSSTIYSIYKQKEH